MTGHFPEQQVSFSRARIGASNALEAALNGRKRSQLGFTRRAEIEERHGQLRQLLATPFTARECNRLLDAWNLLDLDNSDHRHARSSRLHLCNLEADNLVGRW